MGDHICYDRLQNRENMDHCLHLPSEQCRRARPQAYYNTLFDEKEHERTHSACPRAKASPYGRGGTEGDGEGKAVSREPPRSDKQALRQSDTIVAIMVLW